MADLMLGIVLMFGIAMILCIGCILANGTQDHIDYMNDRIRKDQKWRDKNNGWNEWTTLWNNRQKQRY